MSLTEKKRSIFLNKRRATVFSSAARSQLFFLPFLGARVFYCPWPKNGKRSEGGPCCSALLGENPFSFNLRRGAEAEEEAERPKGWSCCRLSTAAAASWRQLIATFFCQQKCTHLSFSTRSSFSHRSFAYFMHPNVKIPLPGCQFFFRN